jgi:hypothetical protein
MLIVFNAIIFFVLISLIKYRHGKKFEGTSAVCSVGRYQYKSWNDNYVNYLYICIDAPEGICCDFIPEKWFHRLLKIIGLTREHQIGYLQFDDALYIKNDQNAIGQLFKKNKVITQAALHLMKSEVHSFRFEAISVKNGKIKVTYRDIFNFKSLFGPQQKLQKHQILANHSLPSLQSLVHELQSVSDPYLQQETDVSYQRAMFFSTLSIALFSTALISKVIFLLGGNSLLLDSGQLFQDAAMLSIGLGTSLLFVTTVAMWRSSRWHVSIMQSLIFGGLGIWGNVHTTMQVLNREWADQKPLIINSFIVDRSIEKTEKNSTYFLTLRAPIENSHTKIEVSEKIYNETGSQTSLNLTLQQGALGYLIIKKINTNSTLENKLPQVSHPGKLR